MAAISKEEYKAAQKKEVQAALEKIEQGVADLKQSDKYFEYLVMQSRFPKYSLRNILLLLSQNPQITRVCGYKAWEKFGRHVKKGEKALRILAPMTGKVTEETEKGETQKVKVFGFKFASVFDVSQTEGEDLQEITNRLEGTPEDFEELKDALIKAGGVTVTTEHLAGQTNGYCHPRQKTVVLSDAISPAQTLKTLAHEIAHCLMHEEKNLSRPLEEIQAESVAFIVMHHFGIDTDCYSFGYLTEWSKGVRPEDIKKAMSAVQSAAMKIIENTEKQLGKSGKLAA